jgi:(R)-2-hydroxyacyl-CoA dehydratese activating ATPase
MISAGIDIGSRTVKLVVLESDKLIDQKIVENSFNPIEICSDLLTNHHCDKITATGYGRHLFASHFNCDVISEIKAFAMGVRKVVPSVRTILDIGGQDTKVISLNNQGQLLKFEMNDRCAAGTGRFLEIMAMALGYSLDDFSKAAYDAPKSEQINSMCTVFAESEIISLVARGAARAEVALGIHQAIVNRTVSMMKRVTVRNDIVFVGGVANNSSMCGLVEELLRQSIVVPETPQIFGALGCALAGQIGH